MLAAEMSDESSITERGDAIVECLQDYSPCTCLRRVFASLAFRDMLTG